MSRNYTSEVATQREYFNAQYFNQTNENQIAKYETTLLKPFFNDPDKWQLAINRFRVPISSIPLTQNNIPLNKWEVGIAYNKPGTPATTGYVEETVLQYNQAYQELYEFYAVYTDNTAQSFNGINPLSNPGGYESLPDFNPNSNLNMDFDWAYNPTAYYYSTQNSFVAYDIKNQEKIWEVSYPSGTAVCSDILGNMYVAFMNTSDVPFIQIYTRTNATTYQLGNLISMNGTQMDQVIGSIAVYNNMIVASVSQNSGGDLLQVYNATSGAFLHQQVSGKAFNDLGFDKNGFLYLYSNNDQTLTTFTISSLGILTQIYTGSPVQASFPIAINGFDQNNNVLLNVLQPGTTINNQVVAIDKMGVIQYYQTFPKNVYGFSFRDDGLQPVESGPYNIYTLQDFLNKINEAFQLSYTTLKTEIGSGFTPTQPPEIVYNANTKLFNLTCEGQYLTENTDGTRQYTIYMNNALYNMFFFPSGDYKPGWKYIIVDNYGFNAIEGTGSATLPQFINIYQETSTIYAFNDLTRIIVGTLSIPVSGDGDGTHFTNDNTTNNKTINQITDILPDTSTQSNFEPVIYIPAGILRWYNLYAQQPFTKIDLIFYYETKDGVLRQLLIPPGEYFSCKLEFKKGLGDF